MGIRYEVVMALPPGGNGQRTRLALQHGDDGVVRPAVLRQLMEGVNPFTAPPAGEVLVLLDVIDLEGVRWGVFELVPGATLRELVEVHAVASRLPALGLVTRVVIDGGKALGQLHRAAQPVAHGGVSDSALLVGFDGVTSVLDLGAPRASRMMAPEQMRGAAAAGPTDVFCLGAALHSAITGYAGPYASAVTQGLDTLPWTAGQLPDGDAGLDQVMRQALHPAPTMRWPDALVFAEQLEGVVFQKLIDRDALAAVMKTLFKDRQAALRDAIDRKKAPAPRLSRTDVPRLSKTDLPAPRASRTDLPAPRLSKPEVASAWARQESDADLETIVGPASAPAAPAPREAQEDPKTASLRGPKFIDAPPPRPSRVGAKPPRASPSRPPVPEPEIDVQLDGDAGIEIDDVPTGAHKPIMDDADPRVPPSRPPTPEETDFDPSKTTPAHKLKVPVPVNFDQFPTTDPGLAGSTAEEKEAARGQEKISTADFDPDEREDGLGGELPWNEGDLDIAQIADEPTNVRKRPRLSGDVDELPAEPGAEDVSGDPTDPPQRLPKVEESESDLTAAGLKKKSGGASRAIIALLLLAIAGSGGYVALMRPDLMAKVKARIAAARGQPAPVPDDQAADVVELDGGEAELGDAGDAVVVPTPADDAGAAAEAVDAGPIAVAEETGDAGSLDGGSDDYEETAAPTAKDPKATKKVKKKKRHH